MEKYNEIVGRMQQYITLIRKEADAKIADADEEGKVYVEEMASKTIHAIEMTIEKLTDVVDKVHDEEKVGDFLDRAFAKCEEAVTYTRSKIAAVESKPKLDLDGIYGDIKDSFDKIMQNENVQSAASFVKGIGEEVVGFLNKPEVKDRIEKAKDLTITAAEKGLDALKDAFTPKDENK